MSKLLREQWFYLLLPILLAAAWYVSLTPEAIADPLTLERVFLFDFAICVPVLYYLFLRGRAGRIACWLRTAAVAGSGLWLASRLMPAGEGEILPLLAWLRYIALPLLVAIEVIAAAAIIKHVYGKAPDEAHLVATGMPPLVAKALLAEARFWKRVARWMRGS